MIEHLAALARAVIHPDTIWAPTVLLALVLVPVAWAVARRLGGVGAAAGLAAVALIGVGDVTILRPGLLHAQADWARVATACVVTDPGWLSAESILNVALFVPFALLAVVAVGRTLVPAVGAVAVVLACGVLSVGIEATQAAYGIGACDSSDVVHNVVGAGIGAAAGLLVLGVAAAVSGTIQRERVSVAAAAGPVAGRPGQGAGHGRVPG